MIYIIHIYITTCFHGYVKRTKEEMLLLLGTTDLNFESVLYPLNYPGVDNYFEF